VLAAEPGHEPEVHSPAAAANRMAIAVLALIGTLLSGYLLLHRLGILGTLACGTGACETVQTSPWATFLGLPVPLIGVGGYIALLLLAMAGVQRHDVYDRAISVGLLVLSTIAFAFSAYLTAIEAFRIHAWCRFCVVSAILVTIIFVLSLAEIPRLRAHQARRVPVVRGDA
jgi:uncharacterized membrane protein